jgi:Protein of unknown function (DUF3038)
VARAWVEGYDTITSIKHKSLANRNTLRMMSPSTLKWEDLSIESNLNSSQLKQIAAQLDLVAIGLFALTQIDVSALMLQAARDLKVEPIVSKWVNGWSSEPHSQIDVDEVKSLVLIINHLAAQHQPLVRQNISYWEQTIKDRRSVQESPALANYISNFSRIYQERTRNVLNLSSTVVSEAALKILVELLLYSSPHGHRRLWGVLLHRAGIQPT